MKNRDASPLDDMTDESIPTSIPLAAVEAMCKSSLTALFNPMANKREMIETISKYAFIGKSLPDWVIAGLNCTKDEDILPICIHSYLMDWRPE